MTAGGPRSSTITVCGGGPAVGCACMAAITRGLTFCCWSMIRSFVLQHDRHAVRVDMIDDQVVVNVGLGHRDDVLRRHTANRHAATELGLDHGPIAFFHVVLGIADRGASQGADSSANGGSSGGVPRGMTHQRAQSRASRTSRQRAGLSMCCAARGQDERGENFPATDSAPCCESSICPYLDPSRFPHAARSPKSSMQTAEFTRQNS